MSADVWEPWKPEVGARVRVRLSGECKVKAFESTPPPSVLDDQLRSMMRSGVDVAQRYARDQWSNGHPQHVDGTEGEITSIDRSPHMVGHYYRVMFFENVEPGALIGMDLAAIELEPLA